MKRDDNMRGILWWARQIVLLLAACFFLFFGIQLLMAAYRLKDPFNFVMTFFSSNLIILISITLMIGFVYRMVTIYRKGKEVE